MLASVVAEVATESAGDSEEGLESRARALQSSFAKEGRGVAAG